MTDCSSLSTRERFLMDQTALTITAGPMRQRSAHEWATTPPFPTPALTASSISSSSVFGERSPNLPSPAPDVMRRTFDTSCTTTMLSERSFDDVADGAVTRKYGMGCREQNYSSISLPRCQFEGAMGSLSSSFSGLALHEQQGGFATRSPDMTSHHVASPYTEPASTAPLLIPMQPTGAGVPLTSVVETLSSKGSKAAAEDPETVAAAYKLSQWGIGWVLMSETSPSARHKQFH